MTALLHSEVFWTMVWIGAAFLALWLPIYVRAARSAEWSAPQRMLWEAMHSLDGRAEGHRVEGRWGSAKVSVEARDGRAVVRANGKVERKGGTVLSVVLALPDQDETFVVRSASPIDSEGDDWDVPARRCSELGAPFRADAPTTFLARLAEGTRRAIAELAPREDGGAGWYRIELSGAPGTLRFLGVAVDVGWGELSRILRSIVGDASEDVGGYRAALKQASRDVPPLPPPPPHRGWARLARSLWPLRGIVLPALLLMGPVCVGMGFAASTLVRDALFVEGRSLGIEHDPDTGTWLGVEGSHGTVRVPVEESAACAAGEQVLTWSPHTLACGASEVRVAIVPRNVRYGALAFGLLLLALGARFALPEIEPAPPPRLPPRAW